MAFNDNINDLFRLAENAAPNEDRIMPPLRKYGADYGTLSLEEAVAKMKARKKDPAQRILGGLDDNGSYIDGVSNPVDSDAGKKSDSQERREPPMARKSRSAKTAKVPDDTIDSLSEIRNLISDIHEKVVTRSDEREDEEDPLSSFKNCRHKVTFLSNGLSFTVRCLNMVKDDDSHCLVLAFPEDSESFFEPKLQSELEIKYDGKSIGGKLFYFGMCFAVKQLGIKFLGFLFDELANKEG